MKIVSQKRKNFKKIAIGIIILGATLVFLNIFQKNIRNTFYLISAPIQKTFWKIGNKSSNLFETIANITRLKREAEELKNKNQELTSQIISLDELKKENENLRAALGIGLEKDFKLELAEITANDISQSYILINKGSKDGLQKDFPVITPQKILIGKIIEVYENYSKVMLISDKSSVFDAKVSEKEIYGTVNGRGNLQMFFDLILITSDINIGDVLVTSTIGGIFPKGLLVGTIKYVQKEDNKPFKIAEIEPFFNIKELDDVFIITDFLK